MEQDDVPSPTFPDFVKSLNPEIETCTITLLCIPDALICIILTGGCSQNCYRSRGRMMLVEIMGVAIEQRDVMEKNSNESSCFCGYKPVIIAAMLLGD